LKWFYPLFFASKLAFTLDLSIFVNRIEIKATFLFLFCLTYNNIKQKYLFNMKTLILKLSTSILFLGISFAVYSQSGGATCQTANPFCSDDPTYSFPAGVGSGSAGSNVGCLYSTPNPAWYYMQVGEPGRINLYMWTVPQKDIDFIAWGPFTAATFEQLMAQNVCNQLSHAYNSSHAISGNVDDFANTTNLGGYPAGNQIDCSYSASHHEMLHIPNAQTGQWYILLITNYSNQATQINFNSHATSTGSSNCAILRPFNGDTVCVGETAILEVGNPVAGANYTFEGPGDFFQHGPSHQIIIPNAQPSDAGTYTMVLHPPNSQPSPAVTANLIVHPLPTITTTSTAICPGENSIVTASGANTYTWSNGQTGSSITVSPNTTTTYTVTGTSAHGCVGISEVTVTVNPIPDISISPAVACSGTEIIASSPTGINYLWSHDLGSDPIITPEVTTVQTYSITVTDENGCKNSIEVTVNPDAIIEAFGTEICIGENAQVIASGGVTYNWSNGMHNETIIVTPTQTTEYIVTGTNEFGCQGTATTEVVVHPKPTADFSTPIDVVTLDNPELVFHDQSFGADYWHWNFGDMLSGNNTSTLQNPKHTYSAVGKYITWLVVTTEHGCTDSTSKLITVESPYSFYIPSAFSPDKDGLNEVFVPVGRGVDRNEYHMIIFDRWGRLIFKTDSMDEGWDGTMDGQRAPSGVYTYRIFLRDLVGMRREYNGHFVLIR
jgi:gliding motility-associated-like protein